MTQPQSLDQQGLTQAQQSGTQQDVAQQMAAAAAQQPQQAQVQAAQAEAQGQNGKIDDAAQTDQKMAYQSGLPEFTGESTTVSIEVPRATYQAAQIIEQGVSDVLANWPSDGNLIAKGAFISGAVLRMAPLAALINEAKADLAEGKLAFFDALYLGLKPIIGQYVK